MGQSAIALLILTPTAINLLTGERNPLVVPCSLGVIGGQSIPLLFVSGTLLFQFINLSAGACLSAIKAAGVQEYGSAHLFIVLIDGGCGEERVDSPVCSK